MHVDLGPPGASPALRTCLLPDVRFRGVASPLGGELTLDALTLRPDLADLAPLVKDRVPTDGKATAYVCHRFTCQMPTTDIDTMLQQMGA